MRRKEWMEEAKEERKKVTKKDRSEDRVGEEGGRKEKIEEFKEGKQGWGKGVRKSEFKEEGWKVL